jgi:hypothetical protein
MTKHWTVNIWYYSHILLFVKIFCIIFKIVKFVCTISYLVGFNIQLPVHVYLVFEANVISLDPNRYFFMVFYILFNIRCLFVRLYLWARSLRVVNLCVCALFIIGHFREEYRLTPGPGPCVVFFSARQLTEYSPMKSI